MSFINKRDAWHYAYAKNAHEKYQETWFILVRNFAYFK